jgi:hypothetical protein
LSGPRFSTGQGPAATQSLLGHLRGAVPGRGSRAALGCPAVGCRLCEADGGRGSARRTGRTSSWTARCSPPTGSPRPPPASEGDPIDAWYSGKHHRFGANIQAVIRPDGATDLNLRRRTRTPARSHLRPAAPHHRALYWAAAELQRPPGRRRPRGHRPRHSHPDQTPRRPRPHGHRQPRPQHPAALAAPPRQSGFALLTGAGTACATPPPAPGSIGDIVRAALSSPNSNTDTYRILAEINSVERSRAVEVRTWQDRHGTAEHESVNDSHVEQASTGPGPCPPRSRRRPAPRSMS